MDEQQKDRARKLVKELEDAGINSGLLTIHGTVVLRSSGAPYTDSPMLFFDETDLHNAIDLDLLEKTKVVGSYEWEWYVVKKSSQVNP